MYQNKMVAAIKVNGKVLREQGDSVVIPFGSEYSILIKNLNTVRTLVDVSIDGERVASGLVIDPNSSLDLERYIRNGNLKNGNKFKFLRRTRAVEEHRGVQAEDGLVRIEYKTEKINQQPVYHFYPVYEPYYVWPRRRLGDQWYSDHISFTPTTTCNSVGNNNVKMSMSGTSGGGHLGAMNMLRSTEPTLDAGFTAPGSESKQEFHTVGVFNTHEQSEVIVLRLRGTVESKEAKQAITVKAKTKCSSCGKTNKAVNKFCSTCGTALVLY